MALLRPGLLSGTPVIAAGAGEFGAAAAAACAALGADVSKLAIDPFGDEPAIAAVTGTLPPVLVWDGAAAFAAAGSSPAAGSVHAAPVASGAAEPSVASVRAALDGAWLALRPVVNALMIPGERGGKAILIAPRPGTAHHEAARAGLENLARTSSIEWARFGIRPVTLLPGSATTAGEVADLAAYVASTAGDYFSGCALTLGGLARPGHLDGVLGGRVAGDDVLRRL